MRVMQPTVGIREAKARLPDLLRRIEAGESILITRRGRPIAELRPAPPARPRVLGTLAGAWALPEGEALKDALSPDPAVEAAFYDR